MAHGIRHRGAFIFRNGVKFSVSGPTLTPAPTEWSLTSRSEPKPTRQISPRTMQWVAPAGRTTSKSTPCVIRLEAYALRACHRIINIDKAILYYNVFVANKLQQWAMTCSKLPTMSVMLVAASWSSSNVVVALSWCIVLTMSVSDSVHDACITQSVIAIARSVSLQLTIALITALIM